LTFVLRFAAIKPLATKWRKLNVEGGLQRVSNSSVAARRKNQWPNRSSAWGRFLFTDGLGIFHTEDST
jgi:hypothetical protein